MVVMILQVEVALNRRAPVGANANRNRLVGPPVGHNPAVAMGG
jgi:hypothetical protein